MPLTFDRNIKASDVLTSLTIIISIVALVTTWTKDRESREREQADRVRASAAKTLAKLERWQGLQLSLYQELQPVYVETSELLEKHFSVVAARDHLWKQINLQRVRIASRVLDEGIETAYVDLFAYRPSIRGPFLLAVSQLKAEESAATERLLIDTQAAAMSFDGKKSSYTTAMLGNALRAASSRIKDGFSKQSNVVLEPIRQELYAVVSADDKTLLYAPRNGSGK